MKNRLNKEQKSGITLLLLSKMFERLAFYLIMAILIQYLTDSLKFSDGKAGIYYSVFYGMIGLTTVFSGLIGDFKDRTKVVKIGFILLTIMYLAIAFLPGMGAVIMAALIILALGIGFTLPNLVVLLGNIYNEKENEIFGLSGFILFSIAINIGGFIAPLLSVFLKNSLGYNSVFLFAFLFGVISLILFLKFKAIYNKLDLVPEQKEDSEDKSIKNINSTILVSILAIGVLIRFALHQKNLTFSYSVRDYLENGVNIYHSFTNIGIYISISLLVLFAVAVTRIKQIKWETIFNIILASIVFCFLAFIVMASFSSLSQLISGKTIFIKVFIMLLIAETLVYPTFLYAIYRSSPNKYKGLLQGISYIFVAISNQVIFLGVVLYEKTSSVLAYSIFALVLFISAGLIMILKKKVNKKLIKIESSSITTVYK